MAEDRIYSTPLKHVGSFTFDEMVVDVFPDMIARSVPGYASVLAMTAELAERFAQAESRVYDLGCSLGASTIPMRARVPANCEIIAVDSSAAMINRLRDILSQNDAARPNVCHVQLVEDDIRKVEILNASFAVLNFTLQFIPVDERESLLREIASGLNDGGALVLSEKVHFDDPDQQALMTELHHDFKRAHGYSELEIAQKRTALENTLITETIEQHQQRLHGAGFSNVSLWFQCFNFISILAVK